MPVIDVNGFDTNPSGTFTFRQCARDVLAPPGSSGRECDKGDRDESRRQNAVARRDRAPTRARGDGARQWV